MLNREPALYIALVQAVLVLAVAFGVDLTSEQTAAVLAVVVAIGAVAVRSQVTPVADPHDSDGNPLSPA